MAKTNSEPFTDVSELARTLKSANLSPSRSFIDLTPRLVLPVGLNFSALNRVAFP